MFKFIFYKIKSISLCVTLFFSVNAESQGYASWTKTLLTLNNGIVSRTIAIPEKTGTFCTTSYKPVEGDFNYFKKLNTDFQFEINGAVYSGKSNWIFQNIVKHQDNFQGDGVAVSLISEDKKVALTIQFLLYPNLPVVRKMLVIKNLSTQEMSLESVDVEKFETTDYHPSTFSWICHDYGRRRSIGPYQGNMQDALVILHNSNWQQGIVVGNEASGVIKNSAFFWNEPTVITGLTHKNSRYPFRKYIKPNESFATPQVFTMVYNNCKDPDEILNTAVPDFVRKHMGIRLSEIEHKPTFVYNTWVPFLYNINEKLIMELAKSAADAGMKEFVIDDGWQSNYGDWEIDYKKFPNGLKPVFDYIKSLGMKPGLWVSVGSASSVSKVYKEHPEWFVKNKKGNFENLQLEGNSMDIRSACFSTGWNDYIKKILMKLSLEYGLEYLKLDFAVVTSPYRFDNEISGCYATDHSNHKDHHESLYVNYERVWQLFDELHMAKPSLFIDCTFEAMGGLQLIDYAMLKHAEGNWLSNFDVKDELESLRVRNMSWWRSPAIPATALVIGNPQMQDKGWELHIKSLAGSLPIMLGDPRKLNPSDLKKYRQYADWLQLMEQKYKIMDFRQDLPGFGEPKEGMWDAFQRVNTDTKSGGIVGVFRHGAFENKRKLTVNYLNNNTLYKVKTMDGKTITIMSGLELNSNGFEVNLPALYDGQLFEIESNN
jgi:alpha-galactosidase